MSIFDKQTDSRCYYCHSDSEKVEAGGIYYCPNVFCTGPGNFSGRTRAGYQTENDGEGEQSFEQLQLMIQNCLAAIEKDPRLEYAVSLSKLLEMKRTWKTGLMD